MGGWCGGITGKTTACDASIVYGYLAAPLSIQFPANGLEKAEKNGSSAYVLNPYGISGRNAGLVDFHLVQPWLGYLGSESANGRFSLSFL